MNSNRVSRSPSRFSPIDEHPKNGASPTHSPKHSPQSHTQMAQLDLGSEKFDTYKSNASHSHSAVNEPVSRRSSGFQNNKGSKENLFNEPIVIPITHINSIPRLSVDVKNGNGNEEWERHDVQVKYHNERTGYPPPHSGYPGAPVAAYYHPMYYENYGYNNRLQFPHPTMLSPQHHQYYPQPDYPVSPKSIRKSENIEHATIHKKHVSNNQILSSPQTTKSLKSHKKSKNQQKIPKEQKPRIYRKIHCCCFSFIWPPFAYEICEPPQPMYSKTQKSQHIRPGFSQNQ